jgi:hypothetical protein
MSLKISISYTSSTLAIFFMKLARKLCVMGFTNDYLVQAIESEQAGIGQD